MPTFMGWGGGAVTTAGWGGMGAELLPFLKKPRIVASLELSPAIVDSSRSDLRPTISDSEDLVPKITDSEGDC